MDKIGLVVDYLKKKYHADINTQYYAHVRSWRHWWQGRNKSFHTYRELGVDNMPRQRELYKMGMAKRICEDWAAILLNEKTELVVEDNNSSVFLQGDADAQGLGGVLGANNFWTEANELVEKAFAYGTGAFVLRVENAKVNSKGGIVADAQSRVGIEYVDALGIIPLTVEKSKVVEAAFVSESVRRGKDYIYLETHTKNERGLYVIENKFFCADGGTLKEEKLPEGMAESLETGSALPWFALIYPNLTNNLDCQNGLGVSVFANAIDNIKGVDLAYNNFLRDFKLGGKKVFYNKSLLQTAADGKEITPDDVAQQLFMQIGDSVNFDAKEMVQEFNPSLRVAENKDGVQAQLDYLSFKCGLGAYRYRFEHGTAKTATEYMGERQELVQHASRHMIVIESALRDLCKSILYIGKTFCAANVDPETNISVRFEDSFVISEEDKAAKDMSLVQAGILNAWEYRVRHFGETEEEAKAAIAGMQTAAENPFGFMG